MSPSPPVIYDNVFAILEQVHFLSMLKADNPALFSSPQQAEKETVPTGLPKTVDEAVDQILAEMSMEEKTLMANTSEENLEFLSQLLTSFLETKLQDSTANRELYKDCKVKAGNPDLGEAEAAQVIVQAIWKKVRETHRLRVVK